MNILKNILEVHPRGSKDNTKKKAIIIGATGATGKQLLKQLLDSNYWDGITVITRRPVSDGQGHGKLHEVIINSFTDLSSTKDEWHGHDVFFNCIGTTRGKYRQRKSSNAPKSCPCT